MITENKDRILDKISKLMMLAKNEGASIGEVENSMAAIKKLMARYNLNDDDLLSTGGGIDMVEYIISYKAGENRNWRWNLLNTIAINNMCETVGTTISEYKGYKNTKTGITISIIGNRTNRKMVIDLYEMCIEKFTSLSKSRYNEYMDEKIKYYSTPSKKVNRTILNKSKMVTTKNKYTNSYYIGCVNGMSEKLKSENVMSDMTVKEVGQYTLMVKKNSELLSEKKSELFPRLRTSKSRRVDIDHNAFTQGKKDAKVSNKMLN